MNFEKILGRPFLQNTTSDGVYACGETACKIQKSALHVHKITANVFGQNDVLKWLWIFSGLSLLVIEIQTDLLIEALEVNIMIYVSRNGHFLFYVNY